MYTKVDNPKLKQKSQVFSDITHASQRSYKFKSSNIVKHLNLDIFKLNPCNITKSHNHKQCINYHNAKDRKRIGNFYSTTLCPYIESEQKCPSGDNCEYSHSGVQQLYHQSNYKKKFCTHYPKSIQDCPYKQFCAFAHNEEEIQTHLIHNYVQDEDFYIFYYKTEWCPLNLTQHEKDKCVYAHNWQDYRRSPNNYSYEPIACFNWKTKDMIYDYLSGCENGSGCNMCHGWKQLQYHPSYYRTTKCQQSDCRKGSCPCYHSQKEKRVIETNICSKFFKFVPKNRIVEGVFKDSMMKDGFKPRAEYKVHSTMSTQKKYGQQNDYHTKSVIDVKGSSQLFNQQNWLKSPIQSDGQDSSEGGIVESQLSRLNLD